MESGFTTYKDIFDVVVVPVTVALLAILFPAIKSWYIRRRFEKLILRELQEIGPFPETAKPGGIWTSHQRKRCIHKEIFEHPTENRDFILSLPPDLVYKLSNFWDPQHQKDPKAEQWQYYLGELNDYFQNNELRKVYDNWSKLIEQYQVKERKS